MHTYFSDRLAELHAEQVDRFLASKLTAEEFLNEPFEEKMTTHMLQLAAEHKRQMHERLYPRR